MKSNEPRQLRVLFAFLYFPVMVFLQIARDIVAAMSGNPNYTTPFPALAVITAALDDLQAKLTAAADGGKMAMSERNTAWSYAKSLLRQLGNYVQANCQNNLDNLLSSGFTPTKTPTPIGPLAAPESLAFTRNNKTGKLYLRFKPVYGTTAGYTVQTAPAATGPFTEYVLSSTSRVEITGQTPLQTLWVRVNATGAAGTSPWSEPASVMII